MRRAALVVSLVALVCAAQPAPVTHAQGGGADFTRFVGVGDSLTAGFQDGALHAAGQQTGYYKLLSDSMGATTVLPLIAEPGIPTPNPAAGQGLLIQREGTCAVGQFDYATGQTTGRIDPTKPATDVAIPGQNVADALTIKWSLDPANLPGTADSAEDFVLGFPYVLAPAPLNTPRTQIETAVGLQPTFLTFWLGNNDALAAALAANSDILTSVDTFNTSIHAAADAFDATGTKGVIYSVPDVSVIPNLFSEKDIEALTAAAGNPLNAAQIKLLFGVAKTSYVPLSALPKIQAGTHLTADEILTKKEVKKIRKAITQYNKTIKAIADEKGWAFVDVNAILTGYDQNGVDIPGVGKLTTAYLGGIFSLDGVHPSATGYALVATAAVQAINAKYGTTLEAPDVVAIATADPEVCMAIRTKQGLSLADVVQYAPAARSAASVIIGNRAR